MQKQIGSILLVAGVCIGSGMIALPMVLSKLGLIPSILTMLLIWSIMYYTSLISIELNLQAGRGLSLGELGKRFSGRIAESVGVVSIKLLSYSLLAAYMYGSSSVLQRLLESTASLSNIATWCAIIVAVILLLPIRLVDYINRFLFVGLLAIVAILVAGLVSLIDWNDLPLVSENYTDLSIWQVVVPVIFTSFGFQVIFHTLTNYCNKDAKMLKNAFLWGSLIPLIVYIIWTCSVLSVVNHSNPIFYQQMIAGKTEVGDVVKELSSIAKWQSVQMLVWWISLLAMITSVIGVGAGLCDSLKSMFVAKIPSTSARNVMAAVVTVLPPYLVAVLVPNAFISVLGFAGMILVIIAILLPVYLLTRAKIKSYHYPELSKKWLIAASAVAGIVIITCEVMNMIGS